MRQFLIPAIAAALVAFAAPVAASETVTRIVPFADLDLTTPEDRATLNERIIAAVDTVCWRPLGRSNLEYESKETCKARALEDAMERVDAHLATLPVTIAVAD